MTDAYATALTLLDKVNGSDTMMVAKVVTKVRELCRRMDAAQASEVRHRCSVMLRKTARTKEPV